MAEHPADTVTRDDAPRKEETGFYEAYAGFGRTLRAWFVGYGVGAPVLLFTNKALTDRLAASHAAEGIAVLFLSGVALQVLAALTYKTAMWYLYLGEFNPGVKKLKRYKVSYWISEAYFVDVLLDLGTIVLFALATWSVVNAVSP